MDIASCVLKANDTVEPAAKKAKDPIILENIKTVDRRGVPEWLTLDTRTV